MKFLDLMGRLNEEFAKTIIMVTHDPQRCRIVPSGSLMLEDGKLVSDICVHTLGSFSVAPTAMKLFTYIWRNVTSK